MDVIQAVTLKNYAINITNCSNNKFLNSYELR